MTLLTFYFLFFTLSNANMHDFLLAKEIIDSVLVIAKERKLENIKTVFLEIGEGSVPCGHHHEHGDDCCQSDHGHGEHLEELNMENVEFGLKSIAKNTILEKTSFNITKTEGGDWKIIKMEV